MTTNTDEIESALEASDAVETVNVDCDDGDVYSLTVFLADCVDTTAPLTDVLEEYELRIWYANFDWHTVTHVPADAATYPTIGGGVGQ